MKCLMLVDVIYLVVRFIYVRPKFHGMKPEENRSVFPYVLVGLALVAIFIGLPVLFLVIFSGPSTYGSGNVAVIPIDGIIMTSGGSSFGEKYAGSDDIVKYIEEASSDSSVDAIVLEINSPGGSAVASDEIAIVVKNVDKPVVALIREAGASGGYWIASSADYIVANRMSITGSIGVISSYLEFSGFMDKYGVGYERLVAGSHKDLGTPFKALDFEEREILEKKLARIHTFFIEEVALNRKMDVETVRELATGEFYLGVEAHELGLVDELGGSAEVEKFLSSKHGLTDISYVRYEADPSLLDILSGVMSDFSLSLGRGMASALVDQDATVELR